MSKVKDDRMAEFLNDTSTTEKYHAIAQTLRGVKSHLRRCSGVAPDYVRCHSSPTPYNKGRAYGEIISNLYSLGAYSHPQLPDREILENTLEAAASIGAFGRHTFTEEMTSLLRKKPEYAAVVRGFVQRRYPGVDVTVEGRQKRRVLERFTSRLQEALADPEYAEIARRMIASTSEQQ